MKRANLLLWVPLSVALMTPAMAMPEEPMTLAQAMNASWTREFDKGYADLLATSYKDDAIVISLGTRFEGRDVIQGFWSDTIKRGEQYSVQIETANFKANSLIEAGTWSVAIPDGDGGSRYVGGNIVRVLDRQPDGSWKIRLETWG